MQARREEHRGGQFFAGSVPGARIHMLWLTFFILLVLWLLGLIGTYTIGAWLHLLLVLAIIVLIIQLATGRRSAV
jgi:hypothetical protein